MTNITRCFDNYTIKDLKKEKRRLIQWREDNKKIAKILLDAYHTIMACFKHYSVKDLKQEKHQAIEWRYNDEKIAELFLISYCNVMAAIQLETQNEKIIDQILITNNREQ